MKVWGLAGSRSRRSAGLLLAAVLVWAPSWSAAAGESAREERTELSLFWQDGLRLESTGGAFRLRFGVRLHNDWGWFAESRALEAAIGDQDGGTTFRRARFGVSGRVYDRVELKTEYDFGGGEAEFKDVWVGLRKIPWVGRIRVGHQKEPFGLEKMMSGRNLTFMERGLTEALTLDRNTGVTLHNTPLDGRMTWSAGIFIGTDDFGEGRGEEEYAFTARVTGLPWVDARGRGLLHLGAAASHRRPELDRVRYAQAPESSLADDFVDTRDTRTREFPLNIPAESVTVVGAEGAAVFGPFSIQGELVLTQVQAESGAHPVLKAFYLYGSWFLTGESRVYSRREGKFGLTRPARDFGWNGGWGALEVAARFSHLDLNDGGITWAGEITDVTVGLNWHLFPFARIMVNYIHSEVEDRETGAGRVDGRADLGMVRFQVDF